MVTVFSPLAGRLVPLEDVQDEVFADRIMGDGIAIEPSQNDVHAPVSGRIEKLFPGGHALVIETSDGVQVMVHVGIDTVELEGDGFSVDAEEGQEVEAGQYLETVDLPSLRDRDVDMVSPVVVISEHSIELLQSEGDVEIGDPLLEVSLE